MNICYVNSDLIGKGIDGTRTIDRVLLAEADEMYLQATAFMSPKTTSSMSRTDVREMVALTDSIKRKSVRGTTRKSSLRLSIWRLCCSRNIVQEKVKAHGLC